MKGWIKTLASAACMATLLAFAWQGYEVAQNIATFWAWAVGLAGIVTACLCFAVEDEKLLKAYKGEPPSRARATFAIYSGVCVSAALAGMGWFGAATVYFLAAILLHANVLRAIDAQKATTA